MTIYQSQAIWELCLQGYPIPADEAEMRWKSGEAYHPEPQMQISRTLEALINQSNYEVLEKSSHRFSRRGAAPGQMRS